MAQDAAQILDGVSGSPPAAPRGFKEPQKTYFNVTLTVKKQRGGMRGHGRRRQVTKDVLPLWTVRSRPISRQAESVPFDPREVLDINE